MTRIYLLDIFLNVFYKVADVHLELFSLNFLTYIINVTNNSAQLVSLDHLYLFSRFHKVCWKKYKIFK